MATSGEVITVVTLLAAVEEAAVEFEGVSGRAAGVAFFDVDIVT